MATHSGILAWRILWTEEPGGLLPVGSHRVGHDCGGFTHTHTVKVEGKVSVAQSCPVLRNPTDSGPPGPSVRGILQARILEWGATPSSKGSSPPRQGT